MLRKDCDMIIKQLEKISQSNHRISHEGKTGEKGKYMHFADYPEYEDGRIVGYSTCIEFTDDWDSLTPYDQKIQVR